MLCFPQHNKDVRGVKSTNAEVVQLLVFIVPEELEELGHIMQDQSQVRFSFS